MAIANTAYSQSEIDSYRNIETFCKVWGFLKYHHPHVARGKYNWDSEFIQKIKALIQLNDKDSINDFYYDWIQGLGKVKQKAKRSIPLNSILSNYDLNWIKDSNVLSAKVIALLHLIKNNTRAKNHYVKKRYWGLASASFVNELSYKDSIYPSVEMRLLTLSRYWNIIQYFYPYKYLTDKNWTEVLKKFIPEFITVNNTRTYQLTLLELFASVNDSHTGFDPKLYKSTFQMPPFNCRIIGDKIIILGSFNDSLCKMQDIRYGDIILKINNQNVKDVIAHYAKYVSASNHASLCSQITPQFIWSDYLDSANILFERDGSLFEKKISMYPVNLLFLNILNSKNKQPTPLPKDCYRIFENNIGYINLGNLRSRKEAKMVLRKIYNTSGAILDLRNYPNSAILKPVVNFFCTQRTPFVKFTKQYIRYPGVSYLSKILFCGRSGKKKYKERVVILIDEKTISFAEHFTMALKTIPNALLIGNHTAGANGSKRSITLPGNITTYISGEGLYYPDGKVIQRIGIQPSITVIPTIEGIRKHQDEILNKAIELLQKSNL